MGMRGKTGMGGGIVDMHCGIVDMHCDTVSVILEKRRMGLDCGLRENDGHLDLVRMKESGYLLQNFALFVNVADCEDPWQELLAQRELYERELEENRDLIRPVLAYEDIAANGEAGYLSAMLTVEEGAVCGGDLRKLEELYRMGVRMLTLTWNHPNELGYPNLDNARGREVWGLCRKLREEKAAQSADAGNLRDADVGRLRARQRQVQSVFEEYFYRPDETRGLTERGRQFVDRMERMGMIVDVSHLSDRGFYDVLACTTKPFVASHSNARGVCRCARNLSDDMIRKLAERGGCMGLNDCADFLEEPAAGEENPGSMEALVRHARYITNLGGIGVLGLGSDFDGIDTNRDLPGAQSVERLWEALHRAGYTQSQLDLIFRGNVLRVYRDTLR